MPAQPPVLLSIDTATDRIHAALSAHGAVHVLDLPGGAQASSTLLPALGDLLKNAGLGWSRIDAIGFGRGPGAFTGLRTACSVAQGLALGLDRPVIAIDTLMAMAEDARQAAPDAWQPGTTLWVLQDARMDELYAASFLWDGTDWRSGQPAQLWPLTEPLSRWGDAPDRVGHDGSGSAASSNAVDGGAKAAPAGGVTPLTASSLRWAGNALQAYREPPAMLVRSQCLGPGGQAAAPRGSALAALAEAAWRRGETLDAALALPHYVRDKVARTTAERQATASPA